MRLRVSIYDSRGRPTIEVELHAGDAVGRGVAPAGASTGAYEAHERRDADGRGVDDACAAFMREIAPALIGRDCRDQARIDRHADRAGRTAQRTPPRRQHADCDIDGCAAYRGGRCATRAAVAISRAGSNDLAMPLPEIQIIGGGAHAQGRIDLQDIMALPVWCAATGAPRSTGAPGSIDAAGAMLSDAGRLRGVADEGGFWPDVAGNEAVLDLMLRAIEHAGLRPFDDVAISLDIAANQFYRGDATGCVPMRASSLPDEWVEQLDAVEAPLRRAPGRRPVRRGRPSALCCVPRRVSPRAPIVGDDLVVTNAASYPRGRARWADRCRADQAESGRHRQRARAALDACTRRASCRSSRRAPGKPKTPRSCISPSAGGRR